MGILDLSNEEFDLFRKYIEDKCSIVLGDDKKYLLETRLARIVIQAGFSSFIEFYRDTVRKNDLSMRDRIVDAITTNETLWFRDGSPWVALQEKILPELSKQAASNPERQFRIWSAACSSGQEPYSLAMIIDDFCGRETRGGLRPEQVEILGTDISTSSLFLAKAGRYDRISMRRGFVNGWKPFKDRYFSSKGAVSEVCEQLKSRVTFKLFNLQNSFASLNKFDIVFLRNVAIYFSEEFKQHLFRRIKNAIYPGGYLFLGSSESLSGYQGGLASCHHGQARYYRNI
ncbi:MAG: protein-glutamate O-methyltransferase CheR [Myxococcota bacterium]|nr:protein-glutamate O-methyltransferase CheR [Myxococcota bacterium]